MQFHLASVSVLTQRAQVSLRSGQYACKMPSERELTTPTERVAWAISQVKLNGVTLEQLAEAIGCSHATLSQWQTGETRIENVKAHLLDAFARETGVALQWILRGGDVRVDSYSTSDRVAGLTRKLMAMEKKDPTALEIVGKMIDAAGPPPPAPPPKPS